ncbi:MAG: PAS domain-containing sensor histidine kinase [Oxalobacteraceae bacterium]|nr:PAS domain-containing sensor histidine kinase [Oxalobacteraceae bacterium]
MTRQIRYMLVAGGGIMSILLFLLASASENSTFFEQNYPWLLGLNALVAVILLGSVIALLTRLYKRYRRGKFGSKLMARLVLLFALMGILPGALIYLVSVQFVSRSIESWFDVRVESALESGLNLGRAALDESLNDLQAKARNVVQELADVPDAALSIRLSRLREQSQIQEATVLSADGRVIATAGASLTSLLPDLPNAAMLRKARLSRGFAAIEGGTDPGAETETDASPGQALRLRVVLQLPAAASSLSLQNETHFLQLLQPVPVQLATNAEHLRVAYSEYQQRSLARTGLRKIYIVTLTLTLLLAIFAAIVSAFLIASGLAKPLLLLAEGTRAVAEGDLSPRPIVATPDELGTLTQSFNAMTRQLFDARKAVERNSAALEHAKAYLESVLANMSAGVMVLDTEFRLVSCNASVERILQQQLDDGLGLPLSQIDGLAAFSAAVTQAFSEQSAQIAAGDGAAAKLHWQQQIEIPRQAAGTEAAHAITLLARGSNLPLDKGNGYVVVFDDISDVISGQRSLAWGEVARRLAHEIKNPLTPIQLSAERLQMKLHGKLSAEDAAMLDKGTATIVNQVTSMKRMVDNFRDYAKTPPAVLAPLDLNALIREILQLYLSGDASDTIYLALGADVPQVMGDTTQLRQVVHNLLQNAQDAVNERQGQGNADEPPPRIDIRTETIRYQGADGAGRAAVRLSIVDNGSGFSSRILASAFEPYVTSKPRGTGLGLAMVKKIVEEHGGRIDIQNRAEGGGAAIRIVLLKLADELADQLSEKPPFLLP